MYGRKVAMCGNYLSYQEATWWEPGAPEKRDNRR
jgi:hypothetical protein